MQHSDQKYIDALIRHDRALLDEIYNKFFVKIKWMVINHQGTEAEASDLFQDALLSIYQNAASGNFILTCPFDAFIYLICKKRWISELRKKPFRNVAIYDNEEILLSEDSFALAEVTINEHARLKLISEKFTELGESCQKLLDLSWGGKPMEEIAGLIGVTYGYARKKKSECMAKLVALVKSSSQFAHLK